ncbi:hypothetical protein PLICRDRAFT_51272 [Plicaturopsis crispa FD-325 SS-3]|nr:hypothetical protein PLICRDRAFT_51272 [Plicaturopsis crispa FD-325 SS-3]
MAVDKRNNISTTKRRMIFQSKRCCRQAQRTTANRWPPSPQDKLSVEGKPRANDVPTHLFTGSTSISTTPETNTHRGPARFLLSFRYSLIARETRLCAACHTTGAVGRPVPRDSPKPTSARQGGGHGSSAQTTRRGTSGVEWMRHETEDGRWS